MSNAHGTFKIYNLILKVVFQFQSFLVITVYIYLETFLALKIAEQMVLPNVNFFISINKQLTAKILNCLSFLNSKNIYNIYRIMQHFQNIYTHIILNKPSIYKRTFYISLIVFLRIIYSFWIFILLYLLYRGLIHHYHQILDLILYGTPCIV